MGALAFLLAGAAGEGRADGSLPLTSCTVWPVRGAALLGRKCAGDHWATVSSVVSSGACLVGALDRPQSRTTLMWEYSSGFPRGLG